MRTNLPFGHLLNHRQMVAKQLETVGFTIRETSPASQEPPGQEDLAIEQLALAVDSRVGVEQPDQQRRP